MSGHSCAETHTKDSAGTSQLACHELDAGNPDWNYQCSPCESPSVIAVWQFAASTECDTQVLPDGCRDVIVANPEHAECRWFLSDLSDASYRVRTEAGAHMAGLRLRPGVSVDDVELARWLSNRHPAELLVRDQITEFTVCSESAVSALECLASPVRSVEQAARDLGVSVRNLQRVVKGATGRTPQFWMSLARSRRAARSLNSDLPLCDLALSNGYADQAHMTRDMKKWFGATPRKLRTDPDAQSGLRDPGYG